MEAREHLATNVWKRPDCYGGFSPDGDYVVMTINRDSGLVDRVNFESALESLQAEPFQGGRTDPDTKRPAAYTFRASHWAVGWVEHLMVRADAPDEIQTEAGEILCALSEYPILNDEKYSAAERDAVTDHWTQADTRDRMGYCREAGFSVFAARRDEFPKDDSGRLYEEVKKSLSL